MPCLPGCFSLRPRGDGGDGVRQIDIAPADVARGKLPPTEEPAVAKAGDSAYPSVLEVTPRGKKCKAMEGLIEEGKEILKQDAEPAVKDAALIGAAQKVEHYEIAGYGTARTHASLLDDEDIVDLLQQTLDEEAETDRKLTELAESSINEMAMSGEE